MYVGEWLCSEPHGQSALLGPDADVGAAGEQCRERCTQGGMGGSQYCTKVGMEPGPVLWSRASIMEARINNINLVTFGQKWLFYGKY